jgi:hypothetical protein
VLLAANTVGPYGAAIIAGASAIVGGTVTAGSNLFIEHLRRRAEGDTRAEQDQRELRLATRLVLAELAEISGQIKETARSHLTWRADRQLPAFAWREYRATLAAHLPIDAWRLVEMAYNDANILNWTVLAMNREFKSDGPIHFISKEWLRPMFESAYRAMAALERTLGEARGAYGYTGYASIEELEEEVWGKREEDAPDENDVPDEDGTASDPS